MSDEELLTSLIAGSVRNVPFRAFTRLVERFGFREARTRGSHHVYTREGVRELINIQEDGGQAKPYQIRQFLRLVERYNLRMEERE
jgi:predicted RNA binding protein YcfA (HicA-like mRNA interferase family)